MAFFDRSYTLLVGDAGEVGLKVDSSLHLTFSIDKSDKSDNKNKATFSVFNLSAASISKIKKDQKVSFNAGYVEDASRSLFLGQVSEVTTLREGGTVKTTIKCTDGYVPVRQGYTGHTFPAGSTVGSIITHIVEKDLKLGTPTLNNGKLGDSAGINREFQKCNTKAGNSAEVITKLCNEHSLVWSIKEGNVTVYPLDGSTGVEVPKLSSGSGMIGSPQRSTDNTNKIAGSKSLTNTYKVKSLLNGTYNIGDLISIVSEFTTGQYRIIKVKHKGSFRGTDWLTELEVAEGVIK